MASKIKGGAMVEFRSEADLVAEHRANNPTAEERWALEKRDDLTPEELEELRFEEWNAAREKTKDLTFTSVNAPTEDFCATLRFLKRVKPSEERTPDGPDLTKEAQRHLAEDNPEIHREPGGFSGALRNALTQEQRKVWGIAAEPGEYISAWRLLRAVADNDPGLIAKAIRLPSERMDARRALLSQTLSGTTFKHHRNHHLDGEALLAKWQQWPKAVRDFIDAPIELLAAVAGGGRIRIDSDLPQYREALLMPEGYFVGWLNEQAKGLTNGK